MKLRLILFSVFLLISCKSLTIDSSLKAEKETAVNSKNFFLKDISYNERHLFAKGKLEDYKLYKLKNYLKYNFGKDIDSCKILTIFYLQPSYNCTINIYRNGSFSDKKPYSIYNNCNSEVLNLHYEKGFKNSYILYDFEGVIYNFFFKNENSCAGMVTINHKGNFYTKIGHCNVRDANACTNELKLLNPN